MLGVLAIIGMLSIGSIAAYSAAMFKLQLTKQAESFSLLLNNAIALLPELQREYGRHMSSGTINVVKESSGTIYKMLLLSSVSDSSYGEKELKGKRLREAGQAEINEFCRACDSEKQCLVAIFISSLYK